MQLSRFTDYSLRVLLYLAINNQNRATLNEIATFYPISLDHLRKVVHSLSKSGYLNTYQGKHGGIELGRDPSDIRIGEVVREFEGHQSFIDCSTLGCRLAQFCSLREVLAEGRESLFETLNRYTLQDLVGTKPELIRLLENSDAARA